MADLANNSRSDVVDLLPSDPFGMESPICEVKGEFQDENHPDIDEDSFGSLNLPSKRTFRYLPDVGWEVAQWNGFSTQKIIVAGDLVEDLWHSSDSGARSCGEVGTSSYNGGDEPHFALFLALHYLGVEELLCVERVCRSLNHAVRSISSLWMDFRVDCPLNSRVEDDSLVKLTSRAEGHLRSLTLVGCFRVTDAGVKSVLERNPKLEKLCVAGCLKISPESILTTLKSTKHTSVKQLRIGGCAGITNELYDELKFLIDPHDQSQCREYKPRFYRKGQPYSSFDDDDRVIDLEKCPKCNRVRFVYDCPSASCKDSNNPCKACIFCVARCIRCGFCFNNGRKFVETFFLDPICFDCVNTIFV